MELSEEELEALSLAFHMYDLDGSGSIDTYELKKALESMGQSPSDQEVLELMAAMDEDQSGTISFIEFMNMVYTVSTIVKFSSPPVLYILSTGIFVMHGNWLSWTLFSQYTKVKFQKQLALDRDDDADMLMAFAALGGGKDMSGHVERKKLVSTVKYDFGLPINIEEMIDALG